MQPSQGLLAIVDIPWPLGPRAFHQRSDEANHEPTLALGGVSQKLGAETAVTYPLIGRRLNEAIPARGAKKNFISLSDLTDMYRPARYPRRLLHRSIPRNVLRYLFSCVFSSEMPRILLLFLAPKAEVSPIGLQAVIKNIRCGDDGHEPQRFPGGLV